MDGSWNPLPSGIARDNKYQKPKRIFKYNITLNSYYKMCDLELLLRELNSD